MTIEYKTVTGKRPLPPANKKAAAILRENRGEQPAQLKSVRPSPPLPVLIQRAAQFPHVITPVEAVRLQQTVGNRALSRLPRIQAKLTLGPVGDKYEQEADAVARQVVRRIATGVQRQEEDEDELQMKPVSTVQRQEEDEDELQMKPVSAVQRQEEDEDEELQMKPLPAISTIQRQEEEEEEALQMKPRSASMLTGGELSPEIENRIRSARGGGSPLPASVRKPMERAFQADFSGVKIHTGSQSDQLNRSIQARAFTTGQDIFFRSSEYNAGSTVGQEILAHELTHVIQQNPNRVSRKTYYVGEPNTPVFDYDARHKEAGYKRKASLPLNTKVDGERRTLYRGIGAKKKEYKKLTSPIAGVVHQSKLRANKKKRLGGWDMLKGYSDVVDVAESGFSARAGGLDKGALRETDSHGYRVDKEGNTETSEWQEKHAMEVSAGVYETVSNIINIANTLRKWKTRNKSERFSDVVDVAHLGAKTVSSVTKVVDSSSKLDSDHRGGLGKTITVKGGGRSSTTSGNDSYQTTQSDFAGKVTGNIADFVGLLADAKDIFFKGKKLWGTWKKQRQEENKASKGDVTRAAIDMGMTLLTTIKDTISTARSLLFTLENAWLGGGLAASIPGLGIAISGLKIIVSIWKIIKANKHRAKMRLMKQAWKMKFDAIDHKQAAKMKRDIEARRKRGKMSSRDRLYLKWIEEYEMQKELQYINRKRINRQVLHISTALTSIAGDIASLSGVGATVGVGLKSLSSVTELGAKGLRAVKQWGRNRAAKTTSWKITRKIFNKDKNTKAKIAKYEKIADGIYDMVIALADKADTFEDGKVPYDNRMFERIRAYIRAVGLSWKVWLHTTSENPDAGHTAIMKGLAERE